MRSGAGFPFHRAINAGTFFRSGSYETGDVLVTATDSSGRMSETILGVTVNSFVGFVCTGLMTSFSVALLPMLPIFGEEGPLEPSPIWPTIDNLTLAQSAVTPVPEPTTYALMRGRSGLVGVCRPPPPRLTRGLRFL